MAQPPPPPANQQQQVRAAVSFLRKVRVRFSSNPSVYDGLSAVLAEYGRDPNALPSPVVDSVAAFLYDQPDLIGEFNTFLPATYKMKLPADDYPAAAKPRGNRDERQRRPAGAAGHILARDVLLLRAQKFLERVEMEDPELHDRVVVKLFKVHKQIWLDAHQVYAKLEQVFVPGRRRDLLRCFAEFLPKGPPPHVSQDEEAEADHRPSSKRKCASRYAGATDAVETSRAKKPRAADLDDDGDAVKPSRPKKPRNAILQISPHADGGAAMQIRTKKQPHATADLQNGADGDSCWLVTTEEPHVASVTFRKMLEFHARYSNLVATMKRAEELERTRHPQGALEVLFPDRECHEILEELYGDGWRTMQVALEDGKRVDVTLATILLRLREEEDAAVEVVRARRDKTRYGANAGRMLPCQSGGDRRDKLVRPHRKA